jgi:hypothetical protein
VVDLDGKVQQVRCRICSVVEGKEKLPNLQLDSLQKHSGKRKALVTHSRIVIGEYYQILEN